MASPKLILKPFANAGDLVDVPQLSPAGFVNFTNGYGPDYEISLASGNPAAKAVERRAQNFLFNLLSENVQQWQKYSRPIWYSDMPGGYDINSEVSYVTGGVAVPYRSIVAANVTNPASSPTSWEPVRTYANIVSAIPMPWGGLSGPSAAIIQAAIDFNVVADGTFAFQSDAILAASSNQPPTIAAGMLETKTWATSSGTVKIQNYRGYDGSINSRSQINTLPFTSWATAAPLQSPAFQGSPTVPTAARFNNTNQAASTSYVMGLGLKYYGAGSAVASGATVAFTNAMAGSWIQMASATSTLNVPAMDVALQGMAFSVTAIAGGTINFASGVVLSDSSSTVTSYYLSAGETAIFAISTGSGAWYQTNSGSTPSAVKGMIKGGLSGYTKITALTGAIAISSTDIGSLIVGANADFSVIIPTPSSIGAKSGDVVTFSSVKGLQTKTTITISPSGSSIISYQGVLSNLQIFNGQQAELVSDGANTWQVGICTARVNDNYELNLKAAINGDASQNFNLASINGSFLGGMQNRIINGDMRVNQRFIGSSTTATGYCLDYWNYDPTVGGKFTLGLNYGAWATALGFPNYLGFGSVAAYVAPANEGYQITQSIEGNNLADIQYGTASAKSCTLSAMVRSSIAGTHSGAIFNSIASMSFPFTFSIPVANVWTAITVNIPGDTANAIGGGTSTGLRIRFNLGSGSGLLAAAGAWRSGTFIGVTGAVSVLGSNGTFGLSGVSFNVGPAMPFSRRDIATELSMCQRKYCNSFPENMAPFIAADATALLAGVSYSDGCDSLENNGKFIIRFPVSMATPPVVSLRGYIGNVAGWACQGTSANGTPTAFQGGVVASDTSTKRFTIRPSIAARQYNVQGHWEASAETA